MKGSKTRRPEELRFDPHVETDRQIPEYEGFRGISEGELGKG